MSTTCTATSIHDVTFTGEDATILWTISNIVPGGYDVAISGADNLPQVTVESTGSEDVTFDLTAAVSNALGNDPDTVSVTHTHAQESTGPAFYALSYDPADIAVIGAAYLMKGVVTGVGGLTTTHTADLYAPDNLGIYRNYPANEPVWSGGRKVENFLWVSDDMTDSRWAIFNSTRVGGKPDPFGGNTAIELTATANIGWIEQDVQPYPQPYQKTWLMSVWCRRVSGSGNIQIGTTASNTGLHISPTTQWQRYTFAPAPRLDGAAPYQKIQLIIQTSGDVFEFCAPTCESIDDRTSEITGSELATNGSFDTDTDWSKDLGWTISGGQAICDGTINARIWQDMGSVSGTIYRVVIDVAEVTSGWPVVSFRGALGETTNNFQTRTAGVYEILLQPLPNDSSIIFELSSQSFIGAINSISVYATTVQPGEYVGTTGNAREQEVFSSLNGNVMGADAAVTEAVGTPLAEVPYLSYLPAAQNEVLYSRDLTQTAGAPWNSASSSTQSYDQVGITGEPNTATLIGNGVNSATNWYQIVTIPADTNPYTFVYYIKKTPGLDYEPRLTAQVWTSNVWYTFNSNTGVLTQEQTAATSTEVIDLGDWWKVLIETPNDGVSTSLQYKFTCGSGDTSHTITVGNFELHQNKTIAQVRGLGPIFTEASSVATDVTQYTFDPANADYLEGVQYLEWDYTGAQDSANNVLMYSGTQNTSRVFTTTTTGTGSLVIRNVAGPLTSQEAVFADLQKYAAVWSASDGGLCTGNFDGTWFSGEGAFTGFSSGGAITIGQVLNPAYNFSIRNLQRYDITSYQEGKDIIDGLMT